MHSHLIAGARGLYAGGKTGTFTPMFFFKARKPAVGGGAAAHASKTAAPAPATTGRGRSVSKGRKRAVA